MVATTASLTKWSSRERSGGWLVRGRGGLVSAGGGVEGGGRPCFLDHRQGEVGGGMRWLGEMLGYICTMCIAHGPVEQR